MQVHLAFAASLLLGAYLLIFIASLVGVSSAEQGTALIMNVPVSIALCLGAGFLSNFLMKQSLQSPTSTHKVYALFSRAVVLISMVPIAAVLVLPLVYYFIG